VRVGLQTMIGREPDIVVVAEGLEGGHPHLR